MSAAIHKLQTDWTMCGAVFVERGNRLAEDSRIGIGCQDQGRRQWLKPAAV
jgi:hypothetical protein